MNVRKLLSLLRNILIPLMHGKPLLLYLSIIEDAVGSMLAQEDDDKNERVVYYLSKRFQDYETRYTNRKIMFCSCMGRIEVETHYPTFPNISSRPNGSIEVLVWETRIEWKTIKMVDPISKIRFEVCSKENHQRKHHVRFCAKNPMEWEDGREDFLDEDINHSGLFP